MTKPVKKDSNSDKGSWKLIFDGNCNMCRFFSDKIRKLDKENIFEIIPSQEFTRSIKDPERKEEILSQLTVITPDNNYYFSTRAFQEILDVLPIASPLKWMFNTKLGKFTTAKAYKMVSTIRRCRSCG